LSRGIVGRKRGSSTVASGDGFVREIIADQGTGRGGIAVLDRVGIGAAQIHGVVIDLSRCTWFERDARSSKAGCTGVGDEVVADSATGVGRAGTVAKDYAAIAVEDEVVGDGGAAGAAIEMNRRLGRDRGADDSTEGVASHCPTGAALGIDRREGGLRRGGIGEGAGFDAAVVRARLNDDRAIASIAESQVADGDLIGCDVEDRQGGQASRIEDGGDAGRRAVQRELVGGEVGQCRGEGVGASG